MPQQLEIQLLRSFADGKGLQLLHMHDEFAKLSTHVCYVFARSDAAP